MTVHRGPFGDVGRIEVVEAVPETTSGTASTGPGPSTIRKLVSDRRKGSAVKRSNKLAIQIVAATVVAVFVVGTWLKSRQIDLGWLKYFSTAVFIAGVVLWLCDAFVWRLAFVQRIPGVPRCVRGTWKGELKSFWIDPSTGKRIAPKVAYLVVRQSASAVSATLLTDESRSSSSLAEVREIEGSTVLAYMYLNRPEMNVEHRSRMHHGSCVLDAFGNPANRLHGRYWTDRDTRGELDFGDRSKKLADNFDDAGSFFRLAKSSIRNLCDPMPAKPVRVPARKSRTVLSEIGTFARLPLPSPCIYPC